MSNDVDYMKQAIELSKNDRRTLKVGAVIIKGNKKFVGYGGESKPTGHAEWHAFENAKREDLTGATLFTTVEPCTVRGHPKESCVELILKRGIKKVVIGMLDPNPDIHGTGLSYLDRNGIEIALFPPDLRDEIRSLNMKFIREQSDLKKVGIERVYRDHTTTGITRAIRLHARKEIDILQTYIQHVNTMEASLLKALNEHGTTVRFVLMNPSDNPMVEKRARDLDMDRKTLSSSIKSCIKEIRRIGDKAEKGTVQIYLHNEIPYIHMYRVDDRIWFSFFLVGLFGTSCPHFELALTESPLKNALKTHFQKMLEKGELHWEKKSA